MKDPDSPTQENRLILTMDDGTSVAFKRETMYFGPAREWKIRLAYVERTGRPTGDTSGPIPGDATAKHPTAGKQVYGLTEKFDTEPEVEPAKQKISLTMKTADEIMLSIWKETVQAEINASKKKGYFNDKF
jgi:hypothetical protein